MLVILDLTKLGPNMLLMVIFAEPMANVKLVTQV